MIPPVWIVWGLMNEMCDTPLELLLKLWGTLLYSGRVVCTDPCFTGSMGSMGCSFLSPSPFSFIFITHHISSSLI